MKQSHRKRILAVIEPALDPQAVVARAVDLARFGDSELLLLLCDPDGGSLAQRFIVSNEGKEIASRIREAREAIVADLVEPLRDAAIPFETRILEHVSVAVGILEVALDTNPSAVVKGTRYHSQAERALFVDTDWRLIRSLPFPLWLVKPHALSPRPVVVAAVDPTHNEDASGRLDMQIVEEARKIADASGGSLLLVHTFEPLTGIGAEATRTFKPVRLPVAELGERMQREHREKLDEFAKRCNVDPRNVHLMPGRAHDLLPWFAREKKADVVVMGAMSRGHAGRDVIGSTAERVLDNLPGDILIVKEPE